MFQRLRRKEWLVYAVYILATAQVAGTYYFLEHSYLNYPQFEYGHERLPFQARLLLAPLLRWADNNDALVNYATKLSDSKDFFPAGISPQNVLLFFLNIACLLITGWMTVRIYQAASQRRLMGKMVYPVLLVLCVVSYVLHTVQNYRYVYDFPSLALFSIGLYLIYFRKPAWQFIALFAVATLNRETSLLLLPFYMCTAALGEDGRFEGRRLFSGRVLGVILPAAAYWVIWHVMVFHLFRNNATEYYPRIHKNIHMFGNLKYYPQLFSALGYLPVFLFLYRKRLHDAQLRAWMWILPIWFGFMFTWGILAETRVYGELIPYVACVSTILVEETVTARVLETQRDYSAEMREERFSERVA